MKFVDVKNDIAFRKIFGNEKKNQILISFLNAILKLENGRRIRKVTIINPYLLPRVAGEKASIIDVRAQDEKGRQFVVDLALIPDNVDDEGLIEAYKDADKHSWKKEELIAYDNASIAEQDERGKLIAAENKGKIEGKIEGRTEAKEEVITRCIEENMPIDMISKIVHLPISELEKIVDTIKKGNEK